MQRTFRQALGRRSFAALALAGLSACSGEISNADPKNPSGRAIVYPLTAAEADQVIAAAMIEIFPRTPVVAVAVPNKGYTVTISFLADSHRITAVAIPATGRGYDGAAVAGYSFEVSNYGSIPITATSRSKDLFASINRRAAAIRQPLPALAA